MTRLAVERQRDEEAITAESSLVGERVVAVVRLIMFALFGLSVQVTALNPVGEPVFGPHPWRKFVIAGYAVGSLLALYGVFRTRPSVRKSKYVPLATTLLDYAAFVLLPFARWQSNDVFYPEISATTFALLQCFSVARFSGFHVFFSTACSCFSFVLLTQLTGRMQFGSQWFVLACFMSLGFLLGWTNGRVRKMFVDVRRRDNLSRFLPRQVAERVLKNGAMLEPAQREVTILFCDIRDFTTMSEKMAPRELLKFLDGFFSDLGQIVKGHDGVVNKFLGDGMLAVWGVPDNDEQHPEKALRAALDIRRKLVEINEHRVRQGLPAIRLGVGIHTGVVAAGMLGGADQHEYTVIGDAVNLASRIEGLTKTLGVDLLVSESTWGKLGMRFLGVRAGEEKVKGRAQPVVVYTVEGPVLARSA